MKIENVIIQTVDVNTLTTFLDIKLNQNDKLYFNNFCVFSDKFEIDTDCCFSSLQKLWDNNNYETVIDIECRIKKYLSDGSYSLRMDKADFRKTIKLKDYLSMATDMRLIDFIRHNYNPRIISNQKLLMKYINQTT